MKQLIGLLGMLLIITSLHGQTKYTKIINGAEKVLKESLNDPFSYVRTTATIFDSISYYDMTYYFYYDSLKSLINDTRAAHNNDTRRGLLTSMRINESYQKDTVLPLSQLIEDHKNLEKRLENVVRDSIVITNKIPQLINRFTKTVSISNNNKIYSYLINIQYRAKNTFGGYEKKESEYIYISSSEKYLESNSFFSLSYKNILENRLHPYYNNKKLKIPSF